MSGCGELLVCVLGTGVPLGLGMDPPLEVELPFMGMGDPLVLGMDPPLEVEPPLGVALPLEVVQTLVVASLLGWLMEARARCWFSSGQKGRGSWILLKVARGGL